MAGRGPVPKPADQRARRNPTFAMTRLPKSGRKGRTPKWPLSSDAQFDTDIAITKLEISNAQEEAEWASNARERSAARRRIDRLKRKLAKLQAEKKAAGAIEREIWADLWKTPQATQWELHGWTRDVAQFARLKAKGEVGMLDEAKEARQWSDRLGLNDQAMQRLRWEIVDDVAEQKPPAPRSRRGAGRYGDLRVVG